MRRQVRTAILASIALHAIVLIVFMGVKIYNEQNIKDRLPIAFVSVQNTKLLRRITPPRRIMISSKLPQDNFQKQMIIRPSYTSSEVFYTDIPDVPEQMFSIYGNVKREGLEIPSIIQPLSIPKPQYITKMDTVKLKEINMSGIQIQPNSVSGFNFLNEVSPIQVLPNLTDSLQRYILTVRMKIESKKRYPLTARKSMIEGRVGIIMTIMKDGQLEKIKIIESSGYEVLDKAALESIHNSTPFPPLPKGMERKSIQMSIYLNFKMM
jgi:TonB family protein